MLLMKAELSENLMRYFSYCNLGYSLLGIIVERACKVSFQDSVKKLIFNPLEMEDSSFNIDDIPSESDGNGICTRKT